MNTPDVVARIECRISTLDLRAQPLPVPFRDETGKTVGQVMRYSYQSGFTIAHVDLWELPATIMRGLLNGGLPGVFI